MIVNSSANVVKSIWVVVSGGDKYGIRRKTSVLVHGLQGRGWEVLLFVASAGVASREAQRSAAKIMVIPEIERLRQTGWLGILQSVVAGPLSRRVSSAGLKGVGRRLPAAVLSFSARDLGFVASLAEPLGAVPVVELPSPPAQTGLRSLKLSLFKAWARRSKVLVLCNSEYTRAAVQGRGVQACVLHPGVEIDTGDDHLRAQTSRGPGHTVEAVVVGRLTEEKGQMEIVRALSERGLSDLRVTFIGGWESQQYRRRVEREIFDRRLEDRVRFLGYMDEPGRILHNFDLLISFRLTPEPFGRVLVEGKLAGLPVVGHALGGPSEIVRDGVDGWLVPRPTPEALAAVLARAIERKQSWIEMGVEGRRHALENFSASVYAERLQAILLSEVAKR
jgi:glycosyltransferase involved in cell wall biosynthesis